ncbi:hypothetical protein K6W37_03580 [Acetobacter senegalensis]|uniref:hypothetical protein n=1 Tax=Acetobacter senegalensis TaxID=446692 RepID=UPI001EDC7DFC|nr:hypothetical protein [Acetobacter senegalensis]MCG4252985.1 hypothetical protein [Acetobacter senegalensis]
MIDIFKNNEYFFDIKKFFLERFAKVGHWQQRKISAFHHRSGVPLYGGVLAFIVPSPASNKGRQWKPHVRSKIVTGTDNLADVTKVLIQTKKTSPSGGGLFRI